MKKVLPLLLILFALTCNAQERVNKERLVFDESSEKMTKATGWKYNSYAGEWIDNNNVICEKKLGPADIKSISSIKQNFISIQSKAATYSGKKYYFFIVEQGCIDGYSGSPYKETCVYIVSGSEYSKLLNINSEVSYINCYLIARNGSETDYSESDILLKIRNELDVKYFQNDYWVHFDVMLSKDGSVRFLIPEKVKGNYSSNIRTSYFETTAENFSKILLKNFNYDKNIDAEIIKDGIAEKYGNGNSKIDDKDEEEIVEAEIFKVVEEMPEFPGGSAKLLEYIGKNIKYPMMARESDIQGKVFVQFVIEPDGSITKVQVLRGIGGGCDEEAMRVVQNMPRWKPGRNRGAPVRVQYMVPIVFKLQ